MTCSKNKVKENHFTEVCMLYSIPTYDILYVRMFAVKVKDEWLVLCSSHQLGSDLMAQ